MKITKPVYDVCKERCKLSWDMNTKLGEFALDFGPMAWVDHKYGVLRTILPMYEIVLTQTDLVAHDDYLARLNKNQVVVLYFDDGKNSKYKLGASRGRLKAAMEKLKASGIKCRYFASRESAEKYIASYKSNRKAA